MDVFNNGVVGAVDDVVVIASAASESVFAAAAVQGVGTGIASDRVRSGVANKGVDGRCRVKDHIFNICGQGVGTGGEIEQGCVCATVGGFHQLVGGACDDVKIIPGTANQAVGSGSADQCVVAVPSGDCVVAAAAIDGVVISAAND